jgi:hypothetical protein
MSGSQSGSTGSESVSPIGESGSTEHNQSPSGDTSQMQPAVPKATTPGMHSGATDSGNEPPNNTGK